MAHSKKTNVPSAGRVLNHLVFDGKKTVAALALMGVMAVMWVRVLTGHKPGAAAARPTARPETAASETPPRVRFVELPRQPGRHDTIERDFFAVQDRASFQLHGAHPTGTEPEVRVTAVDHAQEVIHRVAQRMKLGAVLWSEDRREDPQAFINDRLLRIGDRFTLKDGTDSVEFEVLRIYDNSVLVGSDGVQLTLKIAQGFDVNQ
jgi:hypothetical protein